VISLHRGMVEALKTLSVRVEDDKLILFTFYFYLIFIFRLKVKN